MPENKDSRNEPCQALPAAARRGFREDVLCASRACTDVAFRGLLMPVCRMHEATYTRWGDQAEGKAAELWDWEQIRPATPPETPAKVRAQSLVEE